MSTPSLDRRPAPPAKRLAPAVGRALLGLLGWRIEGDVPDVPKLVAIVAPHTSNWDFVIGLAAAVALGLEIGFLAKDSLFWPPLGWFLRFMGGIPVDRSLPAGVVDQAVASFQASPRLFLALSPEGTRKRVARWKTGFHRLARAAQVPLWPVALDHGQRVVRLFPLRSVSDDLEADLLALRGLFTPEMARHPEQF